MGGLNSQKRLTDAANRRRPKRGYLFRLGVLFGLMEDPLIREYLVAHRREIKSSDTEGKYACIDFKDGRRRYLRVDNGSLIETEVDRETNRRKE